MSENELQSMMKDLDLIYETLSEEKDCKKKFFNLT